jgi:superfamily II DNA helicase RecQ
MRCKLLGSRWQLHRRLSAWQACRPSLGLSRFENLPPLSGSVLFQLLTAYSNSTQIVISPLLGLIDEQVAFMNSIGVAAVALTGNNLSHEPQLWKDINNGKYRILFASPEMLLTPASYFWHKMAPNAKTNKFLKRVSAFILDEAHMIWKWGESGFRAAYRNIGTLKTYFPTTPFLLLSATIAPNVRGYIHKSVGLAELTIYRNHDLWAGAGYILLL